MVKSWSKKRWQAEEEVAAAEETGKAVGEAVVEEAAVAVRKAGGATASGASAGRGTFA